VRACGAHAPASAAPVAGVAVLPLFPVAEFSFNLVCLLI
jgi:hypothetical protein